MIYELYPRYDSRLSFYGKAQVLDDRSEKKLYSYNTLVAKVTFEKDYIIYEYLGKYSQTTTRHQKEFFKQEGLSNEDIKELFKKGILKIDNDIPKF